MRCIALRIARHNPFVNVDLGNTSALKFISRPVRTPASFMYVSSCAS